MYYACPEFSKGLIHLDVVVQDSSVSWGEKPEIEMYAAC